MARTERITILRTPPRLRPGALAGAASAGSGFSTLNGLLISLPSVRNQIADLAGGPREIEARLGLVGQRVDAGVAGGGERGLGVVDLDRGGDAGLEAVARQLQLVLGELQALARQLDPAAGVLVGEQRLAHLLLDLALDVVLLDQELIPLRGRG